MSSKIELKIPGRGTIFADVETPDVGGHYSVYIGYQPDNGPYRDIACLRDVAFEKNGNMELKVWGDPHDEDPTADYAFFADELKGDYYE